MVNCISTRILCQHDSFYVTAKSKVIFTGNIFINLADALQSVNLLIIKLSSDWPLHSCKRAVCGTISAIQLDTKQIKAAQLAKRSDCGYVGRLPAVNVRNCFSVDLGICRKKKKNSKLQ